MPGIGNSSAPLKVAVVSGATSCRQHRVPRDAGQPHDGCLHRCLLEISS